jgi:hypothetical protein
MPDFDNSKSTSLVAIDFHGDQIVTFQHKGVAYVAMRRVVENLGMSWGSQRQKLAAAVAKFTCVDIGTTGADGKRYDMTAMPVTKLPLWLATINPNKITDPIKREKIELYQAESAIALHDYWTKGVAMRDDMAGVVTNLDPAVMKAIGGMVKGIIAKAIADVRGSLEDGALLSHHASVSHGFTAGEVLDEAGVRNRKGARGVVRRVSDALRRYSAEKGIAVHIGHLGSNTAYVFDGSLVRVWLRDGGGKQFIDRIMEEKRGQGHLKLIGAVG